MPFMQNLNNAAGLLSTGNPMLDIGLGLLAQSGSVVGAPAPSLGQAFAGAAQFASGRDRERIRTQAMRDQLTAQKRQGDAVTQLQGLLGGVTDIKTPANNNMLSPTGGSVGSNVSRIPTMQTAQGRQQALGLLADVSPEMFTQGLLGQLMPQQTAPRTSASLNDFMAVTGAVPGQPGFEQAYIQYLQSTANTDPAAALELQKLILESQNLIDARTDAQTERETEDRMATTTFNSIVDTVGGLADANANLAGTFLETGRVGTGSQTRSSIASIIDELGSTFGEGQRNQLNTQLGNFESLSNALVNLLSEGVSTDAARRLVQLEKPNSSLTPEANANAMLRIINRAYAEHEAQGTEIDPRAVEQIEALRPILEAQARGEWELINNQLDETVDDISSYTSAQVRQAFDNASGLTREQLSALAARAEELGL